VILRILLAGALVLAVLIAVKNGWVLRETGMLGSCSVYSTATDGAQEERCFAGTLDGRPDLSGKGCQSEETSGRLEYWFCPAPIADSPGGL
jgi:hypothetical protein